jgi:hypothetical protein
MARRYVSPHRGGRMFCPPLNLSAGERQLLAEVLSETAARAGDGHPVARARPVIAALAASAAGEGPVAADVAGLDGSQVSTLADVLAAAADRASSGRVPGEHLLLAVRDEWRRFARLPDPLAMPAMDRVVM